jgi:hypothetical protein
MTRNRNFICREDFVFVFFFLTIYNGIYEMVLPEYYFWRKYPFLYVLVYPRLQISYLQLAIATAASNLVSCVGAVLLFPTRNNGFIFHT